MGISNVMVHWFERLAKMDAFAGKQTVLDLGPQDLVVSKPVLFNFLQSVSPRSRQQFESEFYQNGAPIAMGMKPFYAALGLTQYTSLDLDDERADFRLDLNEPISLNRTFDVITNFGTLEHVFNPANATKCIHDHLAVGGIALHVLPTRGDYNHGFFNFHSTWFRDLAAANRYDVLDFVLIPDFGAQHLKVQRKERMGELPPRRSVMVDLREKDNPAGDEIFSRTVTKRHLWRKFFSPRTDPRIYDYIFAAFRKASDAPFVMPQQAMYVRLKEQAANKGKNA